MSREAEKDATMNYIKKSNQTERQRQNAIKEATQFLEAQGYTVFKTPAESTRYTGGHGDRVLVGI